MYRNDYLNIYGIEQCLEYINDVMYPLKIISRGDSTARLPWARARAGHPFFFFLINENRKKKKKKGTA
jgi:hypothetical protein